MTENRRQLAFGLALLAVQASVFGYLTQTVAFPCLVIILAMTSVATPWRVRLPPERRTFAAILLLIPFVAGWVVAPHEPEGTRVFLQFAFAHAVGQYFLALQAVQFLIRQPGERMTAMLPFYGTVVLICAGDVYVTRMQLATYQTFVIAFVLLSAGYYGSMRAFSENAGARTSTGRATLAALGLGMAAGMTWVGCFLLHRHWDDLEQFFDGRNQPASFSGLGFSRQARLGSIEHRKSLQSDTTALRVYSTVMPGYLRGAAYDEYRDAQWNALGHGQVLSPLGMQPPLVPAAVAGSPAFVLRQTPSSQWTSLEVWKDPQVPADAVFAPLGATVFQASVDSMLVDHHDVVVSTSLSPGQDFVAHIPAQQADPAFDALMRRRLTELPAELRDDPRLRQLAAELFAPCRTPREKVLAVERWFHQHYEYSLSVRVPRQGDPIAWFLTERPAAHCEFFASGAATLLRMGDVPCRYVTGFVTVEFNPAGGYWLARNRDAHAWVEAYLPDSGWTTVEATPASGVPAPSTDLSAGHVLDDLWLRILRIRAAVARAGWRGLGLATWRLLEVLLATLPGRIALLAVLALLSWRLVATVRWVRLTHECGPTSDLTRLLARMDRRLRKTSLVRPPAETLHQFASRLQTEARLKPQLAQAATWYEHYATVRYRGNATAEDVARLRAELHGS